METQSNGATEKTYPHAETTGAIITHAIQVHNQLGPGLLESVYEQCLAFELAQAGFKVEKQRAIPVSYRGLTFDEGFRADLVVEDKVIVELKCVERLLPIHEAQLYTYLKLSGKRTGLLINFFTRVIKDGIRRIIC